MFASDLQNDRECVKFAVGAQFLARFGLGSRSARRTNGPTPSLCAQLERSERLCTSLLRLLTLQLLDPSGQAHLDHAQQRVHFEKRNDGALFARRT